MNNDGEREKVRRDAMEITWREHKRKTAQCTTGGRRTAARRATSECAAPPPISSIRLFFKLHYIVRLMMQAYYVSARATWCAQRDLRVFLNRGQVFWLYSQTSQWDTDQRLTFAAFIVNEHFLLHSVLCSHMLQCSQGKTANDEDVTRVEIQETKMTKANSCDEKVFPTGKHWHWIHMTHQWNQRNKKQVPNFRQALLRIEDGRRPPSPLRVHCYARREILPSKVYREKHHKITHTAPT